MEIVVQKKRKRKEKKQVKMEAAKNKWAEIKKLSGINHGEETWAMLDRVPHLFLDDRNHPISHFQKVSGMTTIIKGFFSTKARGDSIASGKNKKTKTINNLSDIQKKD